ncbi:RagB/SusD family nutrient uptake outer membrane protein [Fibrella aquatilis]|uniref:RagB/SusD family nutrient uptake outer membrane protein n=1 Tax=Fibrella aquatilis TaxID=2817059 RepID=A0A939G5Y9_9BACT|nr:RagB/SusD family nutrient uptake outer membrane protein [Fibrella aquatilis]MBO0930651.1 RagB/SusD family nutrient uptake outer membrane protein [Fibrella aquatilis]
MKKQLIYSLTALLISLSACQNSLDLQPRQSIDAATALNNDQGVASAIIGAYGQLGGGALYGTNLLLVPDIYAPDNYVTWRGTFASYRELALKTQTNANAEAQRIWLSAYGAINTVNNALASIGSVKDATLRKTLEGEARFIRGILFFELVRLYALPWTTGTQNQQPGVPLVLTPSLTVEQAAAQVPRASVADTYKQVIDDLTKAVALLPEDNTTRADKYTAQAFLARVYLQQENYAGALAAANAVIQTGFYRLNPAVDAVFRNRNTPESIFEIQQNDQNNAGTANDGLTTFYASIPTDAAPIGRGDVQVSNTFVATFDPADARRNELLYIGYKGGNRVYSGKYTEFGANIPVIRLAELYLIRAEANTRLNSKVGAAPGDDISLIRARAGIGPIAVPTLAQILQERRWELAFEGHRLHDIKRFRQSVGTFVWNSPRLVLPIPKREVDVNPSLVQNEGY